jgi:LysM repeat protein
MCKYQILRALFSLLLTCFSGSAAWSNICVPEPGEKLKVVGVASDDTLNVREGYTTEYMVVTELLPNEKSIEYVDVFYKTEVCSQLCANHVEIIQSKGFSETSHAQIESECRSKSKIWYKISSNGGIQGWASAKYLHGYLIERESDQEEYSINSEIEHVVVKGDTAYSISRRYGISLRELSSLNSLDSNYSLKLGQTLVLSTNVAVADQSINEEDLAVDRTPELESDPVVEEAQSILKGLGYGILVVNGIYDSHTIKALEDFFKEQNRSFDGNLGVEELALLRNTSTNSVSTNNDNLECNNSICTTMWGAWVTQTSADKFEDDVLIKYLQYVNAYNRIRTYLYTSQRDVTRDLLKDGRSILNKYSKNFYCYKYNNSILYFGPDTKPGTGSKECDSHLQMTFPKLVFDNYQCVWSGYHRYDNCYFQWIHKKPDEEDDYKKEILIRVRMTIPPLVSDSDQLYDGDILLLSGEIDHLEHELPHIGVSKITKAMKIAEMPVEFGGDDNRNISGSKILEQNSVLHILQSLIKKRYPTFSEGFYYGNDVFESYSSGITSKISEFSQEVVRAEYVKQVVTIYETYLACAEYGLLGKFSVNYVKSKFENSLFNDLSKSEINSLTQEQKIVIRTMANDAETCGGLVLGMMFDPNAIETIIFQRK